MSGERRRDRVAGLMLVLAISVAQAQAPSPARPELIKDPWAVLQPSRQVQWAGRIWVMEELCQLPDWKAIEPHELARLALCRRPSLASAWADFQAAAAREGQSLAPYLPTVQLAGGDQHRATPSVVVAPGRPELNVPGDRETTQRHDIRASWTLMTFGARTAARERTRLLSEAARLNYDNQIDTVLLEAMTAYENLVGALDVARILDESLIKAKDSVEMAAARHRQGLGSLSEVKTAQGVLVRALVDLERADLDVKLRRAELATAVNLTSTELAQMVLASTLTPPAQIRLEASDFLSQLPDHKALLAAKANSAAARAQVMVIEREANPTVSASASYGHNYRRNNSTLFNNNREWTFAVQYTVPLFSGFTNQYRLAEALSQEESQLKQTEATAEQLRLTGVQNLHVLHLEHAQLQHWNSYVEIARFNLDAMRERYLRGVADINYFVNAEREAAGALADQSRAVTRFQVAKWRHWRDVGVIRDRIE
jgi:outer membrane protein